MAERVKKPNCGFLILAFPALRYARRTNNKTCGQPQMNELRFSRKCSKNGVLLIRKALSIRAFFDDWRHAQQKSLKCRMIMFTQGRYLNTVFVRHFAKASAFMALRRWMRMAASAPKASLLPRKSISSAWSRRVMSDSNSWCSLSMMVSDTALWMMGKS